MYELTLRYAVQLRLARLVLRVQAARSERRDCCTGLPFAPALQERWERRPLVRCGRCGAAIPRDVWREAHDQGDRGCPTDWLSPGQRLSRRARCERHDRAHLPDCGYPACRHPKAVHDTTNGSCGLPRCPCPGFLAGWDDRARSEVGGEGPATAKDASRTGGTRRPQCSANMEPHEGIGAR